MASTTDATATDVKRTRRNLRASLITLGLAAVTGIGLLTAALFTSTATVGGNTFSTGKVDLTASPATAAVTLANMAPGDVVTAPITVANSGTLALRYAVKSTTTENALAGQLQMSIKTGVTTCTTAGFGATGTALYNPGVLGTTAGTNVVGDPTSGAQTGDRTLAGAGNDVLCVQVTLPTSTGNSFANLSTTATLDFIAEQTANNP